MLRKRVFLFILLVTFLLTMLNGISVFGGSLTVNNPGFEEPVVNGVIPGWRQTFGSGGVSVTDELSYSGSCSLKITDNSSTSSFGVESGYISAVPAIGYTLSVKAYIASGAVQIYIRYFTSSYRYITANFITATTPLNQWSTVNVSGTAPANAAYMTLLLYTPGASVGTAYFDDVKLNDVKITLIGTQITSPSTLGGAFGKDASGNNLLYTVLPGSSGANAKFAVVDIKTETVLKILDMPGASGAWAVSVASDGRAYAGSYYNGHLYRYDPETMELADLGQAISGDTFIWDLQPGANGKMYGGTYPGGNAFMYNPDLESKPDQGFKIMGTSPVVSGEQYIRSLIHDREADVLYIGVGAHAHLIKYDCNTETQENILPAEYADQQFVYNLNIANGKLFAWISPSSKMLVIDMETNETDYVIPQVNSLGVSPAQPGENRVYYTVLNTLYYYDISTKTEISTGVSVGMNAREMTFVELDEPGFPGYTLVGLGPRGNLFKYNLETGNLKTSVLDMPAIPTTIASIKKGPDGKIYSGGYLSGGVGVYSPLDGSVAEYKGIGQTDTMCVIGYKMYFGVYPGSYVYEYDFTQPWTINAGGGNPLKLFDLKADEQERIMAMAEGESKMFIGTVPDYGKLGGALTVYNTVDKAYQVYRNIIPNQSVISLAYKDGKVIGGTSVWGGLGISPSETEARLFIWDVASGTKEFEMAPVAGKKAITALTVGPDGNIWGMEEGYFFIFNPATRSIIYNRQIFPNIDYSGPNVSHVWRAAFLETGKDGNVYGTIGGSLFKIDARTKAVTTITGGASLLAQDDFGNLYYVNGSNLYKYEY